MNSTVLAIALVMTGITTGVAQQRPEMRAEGKVVDAMTHKGIKSLIRYSSIPTGSIFGKFNDSTFSFSIFGTARYEVSVEAPGYISRTVIVDPRQMGRNFRIYREIRLLPEGEAIRLDRLIFPQGKATIDPTSFDELDQVVSMMEEYENIVIQLEGHTDNIGAADANLKLSQDRVDAVKEYLVGKGISRARIKTKAFGGSQPLRTDASPEARAANRRVELRVLRSN